MAKQDIKRALVSAFDKTGLVDFTRALVDEFGIEIISTGGTADHLRKNGIPVTLVESITGFPEIMDGRVKTLHPHIHAAILADRDNPKHMRQLAQHGIVPIDMVVVNLYPFQETVGDPKCSFEKAIEMIDIGGPCMLRAAAKNHRHVLPIGDRNLYEGCLDYLRSPHVVDDAETRRQLAALTFDMTSEYDIEIHCYLDSTEHDDEGIELSLDDEFKFLTEDGSAWGLMWEDSKTLRYGENPHQRAAFLLEEKPGLGSITPQCVVSGEAISFNNYADADASLDLTRELARADLGVSSSVVFVKHANACGVGTADDPIEAYRRAYLGDPNAAMGGVLCCSFPVTADLATAVMETYDRWGKEANAGGFFVEVWIAPSFEADAIGVVHSRKPWGKRARLLAVGDMAAPPPEYEISYRHLSGGMLAQTKDLVGLNESQWTVPTKRSPVASELRDLRLAWLICKHTKSNAVTLCRDSALIGNGAGQMSRVMSCRVATWLAKDNGHEDRLAGAVAASDAFFPFADGPTILMDAGVRAIIQPGGSKRDDETIKVCDERDVAMILTGTRHFKH